jgi:hypothetical protein
MDQIVCLTLNIGRQQFSDRVEANVQIIGQPPLKSPIGDMDNLRNLDCWFSQGNGDGPLDILKRAIDAIKTRHAELSARERDLNENAKHDLKILDALVKGLK